MSNLSDQTIHKNGQSVSMQKQSDFTFMNPDHLASIQKVANMFAYSDLVPDIYKVTGTGNEMKAKANCIIAIDIAQRIGANVLMVMQNLVIIYGKPSWSSKFLIGTVNTCGRFEPLKYKFEDLGKLENYKFKEYETTYDKGSKSTKIVEKTLTGSILNLQCTAYTTRKGDNDVLEGPPISIEIAINEGWYTKKGSKWPNMSKLMLMYRAASLWTSLYAPDLSLGMRTAEEEQDIVDITYSEVVEPNSQELKTDTNEEEAKPTNKANSTKSEKTTQEQPKEEVKKEEQKKEGAPF